MKNPVLDEYECGNTSVSTFCVAITLTLNTKKINI